MPIDLNDPAARLQALEAGVVALQHEVARCVQRILAGDASAEALLALAFASGHQAALVLVLADEIRSRPYTTPGE